MRVDYRVDDGEPETDTGSVARTFGTGPPEGLDQLDTSPGSIRGPVFTTSSIAAS